MTGRGGWPLNVFLTPEQLPFYGGTYFPPEPRHGMPAWTQVLQAIAESWSENREEIRAGGERLRERLSGGAALRPSSRADRRRARSTQAVAKLAESLDARNGGFGRAPKFPQASVIEFLLLRDEEREMALTTPARDGRAAASTTRSAAAFTATASIAAGRSRTSRRCSTTTPCSRAPTCTAARPPASAACARSAATRWTGRCARCAARRAASTRRSTPTPRAWRDASTCGRVAELSEVLGEDADARDRLARRQRAGQLLGPARSRSRA